MNNKIQKAWRIVLDAVYPPACAICARPLGKLSVGPVGVHDDCLGLTLPVSGSACCKCGRQIDDGRLYCKDCEDGKHIYKQAVTAFEINSELKDSLYRFKYKNRREYAAFYANSIFKAHKNILHFWQPELIIPIPMFYKKQAYRGYNQAELIARELGKYLEIPVDAQILIRNKKTAPLKDCNPDERRKILSGAFELVKKPKADRVLIVDDIYTTGASFDACSQTLLNGGVCEVYGASVCTGAVTV